ncbi:MAG: ATP-binding cassette domain-containing protein [Actinomycetota bacterium]
MHTTRRGPAIPAAVGAFVLAAVVLLRIPVGVVALGLLLGGLSSLTSLGLVLIYRTHRFLNLAHSAQGLLAGAMVAQLVVAGGWNFWFALPIGLVAGAVLGIVSESLLVGRLGRAPRALPMVASLGVAQVFAGARAMLAIMFGALPFYVVPFGVTLDIFPLRFSGTHVVAAMSVPVGLAAMAGFLLRTRAGVSSRALAENEERARSLGVPARAVSRRVWAVAGVLAALGGILTVPVAGVSLDGGVSVGILLLALAPAVVAGMSSLTGTVGASFAIGVLYQTVLWRTDRAAVADIMLFVIVLGAAMLRRPRSRREEEALAASSWVLAAPWRPLPQAVLKNAAVRFGRPALALSALAVAIVVTHALPPSQAQRVGAVAIFALVAASISIVTALTGRLSFGHWAIAGVGAVVATVGGPGLNALVGLPIAAIFAAVTSVALGAAFVRRGGFAYPVATLAFALGWSSLLLVFPSLWPLAPFSPPRLAGFAMENDAVITAVVLVALMLFIGLVRGMRRSPLGRAMLAARDNEAAASVHGISVTAVRFVAFALSGAMAGVAGYLYVFNQHLLHPNAFSPERSLVLLAMATIGGLGSAGTAALGAGVMQGAILFFSGPWELLGSGMGLIVILVAVPRGFGYVMQRARDAAVRIVARDAVPRRRATVHAAVAPRTAPARAGESVLDARGITVRFDSQDAIRDADLSVAPGEIVALLGTNGAGKTTLLRAIAGMVRASGGSVSIDGRDVSRLLPEKRARRGLVLVDGARPVFPGLTVTENLRMAALGAGVPGARPVLDERFPRLIERAGSYAGTLSGGEQRMLAIAQTLMLKPRVMLLDELTFGLQTDLAAELWATVRQIAAAGAGVVVVEHRLGEALAIAHRVVYLDGGRVVFEGTPKEFAARDDLLAPVLLDEDAAATLERAH